MALSKTDRFSRDVMALLFLSAHFFYLHGDLFFSQQKAKHTDDFRKNIQHHSSDFTRILAYDFNGFFCSA